MIRTLRGAWSRRGTLLPLLLLTAVVVAGLVAVIGFANGAGTSAAVAVPLLLLGLVAVPATGRQLAAVSRGEIALARLRGISGGQLYAVLAAEPLLVLVCGALLGAGAGAVVARIAARTWIGTDAVSLGITALPAVLGVVAVGLAAVLVGMAGALREPLAQQVTVAERPRAESTGPLFWNVLLLVAATVSVYRATVAEATDGDWVVLAGPALVGLAVGQVAVWVLRLGGRASVGWTSSRGLPAFLATRRLARVAEAGTPVRLVVAACVVAAVSVTGAQQVGDWSEDTARIRAGAPVQVAVDGDVYEALALTRDLDPDGDFLMAAALVPGEGTVPARRAFLDTERYDAVVGDFFDGTAADLGTRVAGLASREATAVAVGDTVTASVRGVSRRRGGQLHPEVVVSYLDEAGRAAEVDLALTVPTSGEPRSTSVTIDNCAGGCVVTGLDLTRARGGADLPYVLTDLDFAGVAVLEAAYRSTTSGRFGNPGGPITVDDGLMAIAGRRHQTAVPDGSGPRTPILATTTATWPDGPPEIDSPGGDERPAEVLGVQDALPLVEADGLLADLPLAAAGAPPTVPAAEVMVLAAADTPAAMLSDLLDATGSEPRLFASVERATDEEVGAVQSRVYALTALFCLLVAILVIAASIARLRADHLREVAALRLVGFDLRVLRRSAGIEMAALAIGALLASAGGAVVAVRLLLRHLNLVSVPPHAVPLEIGVAVVPVAGAAVVAALTVALVGGRARAVRADLGRPAVLRETAR